MGASGASAEGEARGSDWSRGAWSWMSGCGCAVVVCRSFTADDYSPNAVVEFFGETKNKGRFISCLGGCLSLTYDDKGRKGINADSGATSNSRMGHVQTIRFQYPGFGRERRALRRVGGLRRGSFDSSFTEAHLEASSTYVGLRSMRPRLPLTSSALFLDTGTAGRALAGARPRWRPDDEDSRLEAV